jgi:hypothetical protein
MAAAISNSIVNWCQMAVLEPPCEGVARLNRCFKGVDLHQIDHPKLSLCQRIVDLITGFLLLIPILNLILWVFIRTFGNAQNLARPFNPAPFVPWTEAVAGAERPILPEVAALQPLEGEVPASVKEYRCTDISDRYPEEYEATWRIESYSDLHIVKRTCVHEESRCIYDANWAIQELKYDNVGMDVHITLTKAKNSITVTGSKEGKELNVPPFILEDPTIPWIQQPLGFRPFVLSNQNQTNFYAIRPDDITIREFCVRKGERSTLPPYGPSLKVETTFDNFALNLFFGSIGELWFHPKTAELYQMKYNVKLITWGESRLVR